jgi:hypothetical protein
MSPTFVHVRINRAGAWAVEADDSATPLSEHGTAMEARRAATEYAARREDAYVVLHDRYLRALKTGPIRRKRPTLH